MIGTPVQGSHPQLAQEILEAADAVLSEQANCGHVSRERTLLTAQPSRAPAWSPDGRTIYFLGVSDLEKGWNIWTLDLETRVTRRLTNFAENRGRLGVYGLDTDGAYLYFIWEDDTADLWTMEIDWE